ncbi:helix-turn-helix domain-containing protein [Kocuria koreensis]|jgi:transcriptional regulator with XRE-family HTH domain|uniref:Helix-turn-helix domain-containing protein n=1 Tax=Rothia koreensis TaxID=592378 RepID=A0A7K1LFF5_9MICC|nr:helix-turn-helix transcriptional regulator [Rothia koreensis]MUN53924.1 helix-turn-helix domain-containing protein [Rothia koreensis]
MPRDPWKTFAHRLRHERLAAGINQATLADAISEHLDHQLDGSTVSRIESGRRAVRLDEAVVAAEQLGVPLAALLEEVDTLQERIDKQRDELIQAREAVVAYEEQLHRARASVIAIEKAIAELESSRPTPIY